MSLGFDAIGAAPATEEASLTYDRVHAQAGVSALAQAAPLPPLPLDPLTG